MGQERLRNLAILSIQHSMTRNLKFDVVIYNFAAQKTPQKILIIKILTKNKIVISIQYAL